MWRLFVFNQDESGVELLQVRLCLCRVCLCVCVCLCFFLSRKFSEGTAPEVAACWRVGVFALCRVSGRLFCKRMHLGENLCSVFDQPFSRWCWCWPGMCSIKTCTVCNQFCKLFSLDGRWIKRTLLFLFFFPAQPAPTQIQTPARKHASGSILSCFALALSS